MDKDGIAVSVLSVSTPSIWLGDAAASRTFTREVNEAAAKMQRDYKGRFGHFAALALPDVEGSLREIEYAFDKLNADGIALTTNYMDKYPGDEAFADGVRRARPAQGRGLFPPDRGELRLQRHPQHPAADRSNFRSTPPARSSACCSAARCTAARTSNGSSRTAAARSAMIANRLVGLAKNRPELNARVPNGVMHELSKLYVDVVGVTTPGALKAVLDIVPMSHLLFGTDYPFWSPETTVKGLAGLKLSAADLQAIERDNALKLLPTLPH